MAHELDMSNGRANMAYVGDAPWHSLGKQVSSGLTPSEMGEEAGINWNVIQQPMYLADGTTIPDRLAVIRQDTGAILSTCGPQWKPHQNSQLLKFFEEYCAAGMATMETIGALKGGREIWALANLGDEFSILGEDVVKNYLLLTGSHKPGIATKAYFTSVRVVCNNTLNYASNLDGRGAAHIHHRVEFNRDTRDAIKEQMGIGIEQFKAFRDVANELAEIQLSEKAANEFVVRLLGNTKEELYRATGSIENQPRKVGQVLELFDGKGMGSELRSANGTAWGLLNAVTEHVDHHAGRTNETRLASAWTGEGNRVKNFARDLMNGYIHTGEFDTLVAA